MRERLSNDDSTDARDGERERAVQSREAEQLQIEVERGLSENEKRLRHDNAELAERGDELQQTNVEIRNSRRAALNLMEDAMRSQRRAEALNAELRSEIAERKRAEEALRERAAWQAGQKEALQAALNGAPLETSLGALVGAAIKQLGQSTRAAFHLADPEGASLHHVVGMPADYAECVDGFNIGPESLACGLAMHTGQAILTSDVKNEPLWRPWLWLAERFEYRGCWSFPIHTSEGKFVGTLAIYWRQPHEATERDREFASLLTQTASIIISRQIEAEDRKRAEQDAIFLADLAERIRLAKNADELMWEVTQLVGEHLQVARCIFIEIDAANDRGVVRSDYSRGGAPVVSEYRISDYSSTCRAEMEAGRTVANRDSQTDPRTAALYETTYRKAGKRAYVAAPLGRDGRWAATLWVSVDQPRDWAPREVALLETIAEWTWLAMEKLQSEHALRESEMRYRATFDNAAVGIAHIGFDGRWLRFNDAVCDITGYSRQELLRKTFADITHPDDIEADWAQARRVLAGEIPTYSMEKRYIRKDGSIVWIYLTVSLMSDATGAPQNFISVIEDITDRKQAEDEIARLLAEEHRLREIAEQAMRAKDEFLGVVSHELRSPLNAILGWSRLLRSQRGDDPQIATVTETIERSGKAQLQLIEDLLDTTRIIAGKMKLEAAPVELVDVISLALDTVRPAANNKGIAITANLDPKAGQITGDPDRLQQVVWNLVSNAIKFTPEGGRVWVELRRGDTGVQIVVRDTGQGIAPDLLPYVFDRFKQGDSSTSRRFGGLGLGLALVKHLIELHGGGVTIESPGEGQGTTFTVNLPVRAVRGDGGTEGQRDGETAVDWRAHRRTRTASLDGVRVLVVDDEAGARELLTIALEQYGASVTCADSAEAAIAAIESRLDDAKASLFDVLISDIGMPDADGCELIRRVRAHANGRVRDIRAIALTAYARSKDRLRALQAGFQMHVPKPVDEEELTTVIAALTGRISGNE